MLPVHKMLIGPILVLFLFIQSVLSATQMLAMDSCYTAPFKGFAFRLVGGEIRGKVNCTNDFEPPNNDYYFSVRINTLNLKRIGNSCPHFDIIAYTTKRVRHENDVRMKGWEVLEPADPNSMKRLDCKNYLDDKIFKDGMVIDTSAPGQKLLIQYNADGMDPAPKPFDITISSFIKGTSAWNCPEDHYRCWESKFRCLDRELECDGEDNCYDNSDEYNFHCTGRLMGMKLPVFLIFLLAIVLVLITCITILVCILVNRHKKNKRAPKDAWGDRRDYKMEPVRTLAGPGSEYPEEPMA